MKVHDNNNNMYLGPVVVAQQVLDPSSQHPHLREQKKGAHPLQPSLLESNPIAYVLVTFSRCLW